MRASRLLSILILLQLRQRLTADMLADEFEVSVRTIYRDIDALSAAGIPIYSDRGPGGGFQLIEGYRTKLTGLDPDEAEAMLLISLPGEAQAMGLGNAATRARNKLLAALPKAGSEEANRIAGRFHFDTAEWYRAARPAPLLKDVARAVLDRHVLDMTYSSWRKTRDWQVEPLGLVLKAGNWYLVASGKTDPIVFNIADIQALEVLPRRFEPPGSFDLATWWDQAARRFESRLRPNTAIVRASPVGLQRLRLLGTFAGDAIAKAAPADRKGWTQVALPVESLHSAAPMLLGIGPEIDIVEPAELRDAVRDLASQVIARIQAYPEP